MQAHSHCPSQSQQPTNHSRVFCDTQFIRSVIRELDKNELSKYTTIHEFPLATSRFLVAKTPRCPIEIPRKYIISRLGISIANALPEFYCFCKSTDRGTNRIVFPLHFSFFFHRGKNQIARSLFHGYQSRRHLNFHAWFCFVTSNNPKEACEVLNSRHHDLLNRRKFEEKCS